MNEEEIEQEKEENSTTATVPSEDDIVLTVRIVRRKRPVSIEKDDGTQEKCEIRELIGADKDSWLNFIQKRAKIVGGTPVGMTEYKGVEDKLIAMCLFHEDGRKFSEKEIEPWPTTAKKALFLACQKINGLEEKSKEEAKND